MLDSFAKIFEKYGGLYLEGLGMTVQLTVLSLLAGFVLAWPMAFGLLSGRRWVRFPLRGFVYYMTGTPLLVQLFLVYFGLGQFETVRESVLWPLLREPYWCALVAFTLKLNTAGYSAEIFRGAIAIRRGGRWRRHGRWGCGRCRFRGLLVIPSAFRRALPAYGMR